MACCALRTSETLAIALIALGLLQLMASAAAFYFGLGLQYILEVDLLAEASILYKQLPLIMMGLGAASTLHNLFGMAAVIFQSREALVAHAVITSASCLLTAGTALVALLARTSLVADGLTLIDVGGLIQGYSQDTKDIWDRVQINNRCCGGTTYSMGYRDWSNNQELQASHSVPDSCCHQPADNCGTGVLALPFASVHQRIFVPGCLQVLEDLYQTHLAPVLLCYAAVAIVWTLAGVAQAVLTGSNAVAIQREEKRQDRLDADQKKAAAAAFKTTTVQSNDSHHQYISAHEVRVGKANLKDRTTCTDIM